MGRKNFKNQKPTKKLTKKEKKQQNHLKLIKGHKDADFDNTKTSNDKGKAA
ncbi:hypothetical protein OAB57_01895 [Bacteriovoracaceae bacterium]|nr:hypothetical protein [Bacteriovoracaceae bacterium]